MAPACARRWRRGEGALLFGPVVHAGEGNKTGEWRCVLFITWYITGVGKPYDNDFQIPPWVYAKDYAMSTGLLVRAGVEYFELKPWNNYGGQFKQVSIMRSQLSDLALPCYHGRRCTQDARTTARCSGLTRVIRSEFLL